MSNIDNASFWDELCGSQAARLLGVSDSSPKSLKVFDDWYFRFYPYLEPFLRPACGPGLRVLEVGLGYGTVSQYLAEQGADLTALDIARGPVAMVNQRLKQGSLPGRALQASILDPGLTDSNFDAIVAIGALHHTGDLPRSIEVCRQLLRPGGQLLMMVYYAYSYRRWHHALSPTLGYGLRELVGFRGVVPSASERERQQYDANSKGAGAPHTDWISRRSAKYLLRQFSSVSVELNNIDAGFPLVRNASRDGMLSSRWPRRLGLDLYITATK